MKSVYFSLTLWFQIMAQWSFISGLNEIGDFRMAQSVPRGEICIDDRRCAAASTVPDGENTAKRFRNSSSLTVAGGAAVVDAR